MSVTREKGTVIIETEEFNFRWDVHENFRIYQRPDQREEPVKISKPIFLDDPEETWLVTVYPYGFNEENEHFVSVEVLCINSSYRQACVSVSILNDANSLTMHKEQMLYLSDSRHVVFGNFISRDLLWDKRQKLLLRDKKLVLQLCVYFHCSVAESFTPDICDAPMTRLRELDEYERLLHEPKYSDLRIIVGNRQFSVHRNILAMRSPVFARIFEQLQQDSTIMLTDLDAETMAQLLCFVYAGKAENLENLAEKLLKAADKYELAGLKARCEKYLLETLCVHNVCERLTLAEEHGAFELVKKAMEFLENRINDVVATESYESFIRNCTPRLAKLINSLTKKPGL